MCWFSPWFFPIVFSSIFSLANSIFWNWSWYWLKKEKRSRIKCWIRVECWQIGEGKNISRFNNSFKGFEIFNFYHRFPNQFPITSILQYSSNHFQYCVLNMWSTLSPNQAWLCKYCLIWNKNINPTKASLIGMSPEHLQLATKELNQLQTERLIEPTTFQWICQAFNVNKKKWANS